MSVKNPQEIESSQKDIRVALPRDVDTRFPWGAICCRVEKEQLIPEWFSKKMPDFSGYSYEEFQDLLQEDFLNAVFPEDRQQVLAAITTQDSPDLYFRLLHKEYGVKWCRMSGRVENTDFPVLYGFITEMSDQAQLLQSIADEIADEIYVIHKETYELLYINHSGQAAWEDKGYIGKKCYEALYGKTEPCSFCTLKSQAAGSRYHTMPVEEKGRFINTKFHTICWNGMPAYVKYIHDVTEDVLARKEKERLEQYFQTVLNYLPGGVAVVCHMADGSVVPEFLSNGFVEMVNMSYEDAWKLYMEDAMAGVHPEDREYVSSNLRSCISGERNQYEMTYRLQKGDDGYLWVRATFSVIQNEGKEVRVYVNYHDVTEEREAQEQLRQQYENMIYQHHAQPGPDVLILGHCNVTKNVILKIDDYTDSDLLQTFGSERDPFFAGIGSLVVDEKERELFLKTYLNEPSLAAFERGDREMIQNCFVRLPKDPKGKYVQIKVILVETPDTGDVTGILTVTDMTNRTVREMLLHQLTEESYDLVADVDLFLDRYVLLAGPDSEGVSKFGKFSDGPEWLQKDRVLTREREYVLKRLEPEYIFRHLKEEGSYSLSYSVAEPGGQVHTKSLKVFAVDLELGRVCLARTDITESVRQQQGLLNMIAYTFDMAGFLDLDNRFMTVYTRDTVLKNLPPYVISDYAKAMTYLEKYYPSENVADIFDLQKMCRRLKEAPSGYDFVLAHQDENGLRYKQINVLWGNETRRTICMVRADVTDTLAAEYQAKAALEQALEQAEEASKAKSDFLASMSHDIRTPMNAIMGMTSLALAHLEDPKKVEDYLKKISVSSKHLLSLINDILDMSQIEQSRIQLNDDRVSMAELVEQLGTIMMPQAKITGIRFSIHVGDIAHPYFMGDSLRINQILINILSNAFKFTAEGGTVDFSVEEIPARQQGGRVRYRFVIRDTGVGMSEEFLKHLFDPFVRCKETMKVEGTGLGLSITKALVDLMGGTISVESRLHQGTVFQVELEWQEAEDREEKHPGAQAGTEKKENVLEGLHFLIVEDNAINSEILAELLEIQGATSEVRENGYLGVLEFQNAPLGTYDAILMDIQMPVMNGLEAAAAIRSMERADAQTIPIIAMTANAFAEDVKASLQSGMNAHVAKPISIEALRMAVARFVRK